MHQICLARRLGCCPDGKERRLLCQGRSGSFVLVGSVVGLKLVPCLFESRHQHDLAGLGEGITNLLLDGLEVFIDGATLGVPLADEGRVWGRWARHGGGNGGRDDLWGKHASGLHVLVGDHLSYPPSSRCRLYHLNGGVVVLATPIHHASLGRHLLRESYRPVAHIT